MKKILIALLAFTCIQIACLYYFVQKEKKQIVYADAIKLFNEYKFKADLERSSQATLSKLKNELDSVEVIYKVNKTDQAAQALLQEKQQQMAQGYSLINKEINEKVWERLNPLIHEFGKEKHIELLIGANGMGTVLYASEARDITTELIQYVNKHYEKGN